jgi:hypothetical protein
MAGRLVTDLGKRLTTPGSVVWDVTNDNGDKLATGVYLMIFDFGATGIVREKLFVVKK